MSQWTHLSGIIRLDSMGSPMVRGPVEEKDERILKAVTEALGQTCDFESDDDAWDKCTVPMGSEGSLQYKAYKNKEGDEHSLSWGYVAIWGDLRDFGSDDVKEIKDWFQNSIKKLRLPEDKLDKITHMLSTFSIRDAVLSIDVEGCSALIIQWDNELEKVIEYRG